MVFIHKKKTLLVGLNMREHRIAIIDYGMGNIGSVQNMLKKIGYTSYIAQDEAALEKATHLILPGVGAFDVAMTRLEEHHLVTPIRTQVLEKKKPILGICLGMQLLGKHSQEGIKEGLSLLDFSCIKFPNHTLKVPNMGWQEVTPVGHSLLTDELYEEARYYFVHSYYVPFDSSYTVLSATYGLSYTAALNFENIYGTQFHPEKSHRYGMQILKNFLKA